MVTTQGSLQQLLTLFQSRRYAEMETLARTMLTGLPREGSVWKALGVALQMQGKDALVALTEAARLLPGDAEAATNLGAMQSDRGLHAGVPALPGCVTATPPSARTDNRRGPPLH